MQFQQNILWSLFVLPKSFLCLQHGCFLCIYRSCCPWTAVSADMSGGQQRALFWSGKGGKSALNTKYRVFTAIRST